ncbi:MAG: insulinase family protein [Flavobacteriales bacterium]|nr:insulinase family protein [Flavobacteriales bacterium]
MTMLKKALLVASVILLTSLNAVFAQSEFKYEPETKLTVDPAVKVGKLKNGLTYYIRKNALPENKAELRIVVNAGSVLENESQRGLAHFCEHMAFNGSKDFPGNDLIKKLEDVGVRFGYDLNAYTSFDETVYMIPIPADKIDLGLQVLQNWGLYLSMDGAEIDKERGVILEEQRLGRGASERMAEKYFPVLLGGSKYPERMPIGKEEVLKTFSYDTLRDFYHSWYRPSNMAVIVVGDIDPAVVEQKIKDLFSKAKDPKKAPKREEQLIPEFKGSKAVVVTDKEMTATQVQVMFRTPVVKEITEKDYVTNVKSRLYAQMLSSRLQEIAQKPGAPFMYAVAGHGGVVRDMDAFQAIAVCAPGGALPAFKALLTETERAQRFGFVQSELDRAKAAVLSGMERSYANRNKQLSSSYVGEYQRNFLQNEPIPGIEYEYNLIKTALPTITLEQMNALNNELITDDNRVVMVLGPQGQTYPTEEALMATFSAVEKDNAITAYSDDMAVTELMKNAPKAGKVVSEKTYDKVGVTVWTLSNGAKVVLKPTTFKDDEVLMYATSKGGRALYGAEDDINITNATYIASQSGLNGIKATDLRKLLTGKNASVRPSIGTYSEGMSGSYVKKDAKTAFELLYLNFTAPFFDTEAFEVYKKNEKDAAIGQLEDPDTYFQYERNKFLANGNQRTLNVNIPMPEDYDKIDLKRAEQIYRERFAGADDFTFFFVGSFTLDEIRPLVETYVASLPSTGVKETVKDISNDYPTRGQEKQFYKGVDAKAQVRLVYKKYAPYTDKESYNFSVFNSILSTRLLDKLREEMGGTYSVGANGSVAYTPKDEANFLIAFSSNLDMYRPMIDEGMKILKQLLKDGPTEKEIAAKKEQQLVQWNEAVKMNGAWMSMLIKANDRGADIDKVLEPKSYIDSLNAKDLKAAGNKYIDADQWIRIICLPEKK